MEKEKYIEQLQDIRSMMDRSSRFLSLSGLSGILAGIYAITGAFLARKVILESEVIYTSFRDKGFLLLISISVGVMLLSLITAALLSMQKSKKRNERIWNPTTRRIIINFCIPMFSGGILAITFIQNGYFGLLAPITLIFYGLSLLHCSKYTYENVRYLGISFLILGLTATQFPGKGLLLWMIGFGGFHIVYGSLMYFIVERKQA